MDKTVSGSLQQLETPDDFYGVKHFIDQGGFKSDWFRSLSANTQLYYQRMYWNASNACFSEDPFPEARIKILGNDSDVLWERIDLNDIKAIYDEYVECWEKHPELRPIAFKDFDFLQDEVKDKTSKSANVQ